MEVKGQGHALVQGHTLVQVCGGERILIDAKTSKSRLLVMSNFWKDGGLL